MIIAKEILRKEEHGDCIYKLYLPHSALRPFVRCYWILKSQTQSLKPELFIPDGYADLIFNYGQTYRRAEFKPELNWLEIPSSHLVGGRRETVLVGNSSNLDLIGVKLNPYGLWALTQIPSADFFRQIASFELLSIPFLSELEQRIFDASGESEKIQVLERFLSAKILPFALKHQEVQRASQIIVDTNGSINMKKLSEAVNLSSKGLERLFEKYVGMPPKVYSGIIRFKKLLQAIKQNPRDGKHLYLDFGYYDQNHFIKDFKRFMGTTPTAYGCGKLLADDKFFTLGTDHDVSAWLSSSAKN